MFQSWLAFGLRQEREFAVKPAHRKRPGILLWYKVIGGYELGKQPTQWLDSKKYQLIDSSDVRCDADSTQMSRIFTSLAHQSLAPCILHMQGMRSTVQVGIVLLLLLY